MAIIWLLNDKNFLELLDENNSEKMALYLSDLRASDNFKSVESLALIDMFNDLQIFTNVGINSIEDKKFIITYALISSRDRTIDLRNKILANSAVYLPENTLIIVDDTTANLINQNKPKSIEIAVTVNNIIKFYSLPKDNLFYFSAYSSKKPSIKFKVDKNITNFEDYLKSQCYFTIGDHGKPLTREAVINELLQHVEYI